MTGPVLLMILSPPQPKDAPTVLQQRAVPAANACEKVSTENGKVS